MSGNIKELRRKKSVMENELRKLSFVGKCFVRDLNNEREYFKITKETPYLFTVSSFKFFLNGDGFGYDKTVTYSPSYLSGIQAKEISETEFKNAIISYINKEL